MKRLVILTVILFLGLLPAGVRGSFPGRPWGQREARGINTGICTKKGHRRESMTFFRGDSRNRIDTAFSPTGLYKSLFYAEEMQV